MSCHTDHLWGVRKRALSLLARQCLLHEAHASSQKRRASPRSSKLQRTPEPRDKRTQEEEQHPALKVFVHPEQKSRKLSQAALL